jgi:ribosomal protein S14
MKRCNHCDVELNMAASPPDYAAQSITARCQEPGGDHKIYDKPFDLCQPCMGKLVERVKQFIEEERPT